MIKRELDGLDDRLAELARSAWVDVFALDDEMLARTTQLALEGITKTPFDQAILASVIVSAERLWSLGERAISFCELDSDLQPWGRHAYAKRLRDLYDAAHVWVYGDFTLTGPARRENFL